MTRADALDAVRDNRDALEALKESDLRCAKYAEALLDTLEDADASQ